MLRPAFRLPRAHAAPTHFGRCRKLPALALLAVFPAGAVEVHLQFAALERMLSKQVFTQDGRKYVKGSEKTRCNFAYLEQPKFQGKDGRLVIRARFSGRSSLNMFGQCVGLGDAFTVVITATPVFQQGNVGLAGVSAVSDGKNGFYIRRVCQALSSSLSRDFHYPLASEAQRALEDPGMQPDYRRELRQFRVSEIRVTNDALVLVVDFELTVK